MTTNNWSEWQNAVLGRLDLHKGELEKTNTALDVLAEKTNTSITELKIDVAKLKIRASIWGLLAGAIPVGIYTLVAIMRGGI